MQEKLVDILPGKDFWMIKQLPGDGIAVASSVVLARNINGFVYPPTQKREALQAVRELICGSLRRSGILGRKREFFDLDNVTPVMRGVLRERRFISSSLHTAGVCAAVLVNGEQDTAITVNDTEHIRMIFHSAGLQLKTLWRKANLLDSRLASRFDFAFDPDLGYLSSSPDNSGTALKAEVVLHLPALEHSGALEQLFTAMLRMGIAVAGYEGEGCGRCGSMYVFSNLGTLGESEAEIITGLSSVVSKIIAQERNMRLEMLKKEQMFLWDKVSRAYGMFRYCRLLHKEECLEELSWLRLGIDLGMFEHLDREAVSLILLFAGNAHLALLNNSGKLLSAQQQAAARADIVRDMVRHKLEAAI